MCTEVHKEEHKRPHLNWCGSEHRMPLTQQGKEAAATTQVALDRYSRIMVEYLTYTFMGNIRDITLTPTIKRKKIAKKRKYDEPSHFIFKLLEVNNS